MTGVFDQVIGVRHRRALLQLAGVLVVAVAVVLIAWSGAWTVRVGAVLMGLAVLVVLKLSLIAATSARLAQSQVARRFVEIEERCRALDDELSQMSGRLSYDDRLRQQLESVLAQLAHLKQSGEAWRAKP